MNQIKRKCIILTCFIFFSVTMPVQASGNVMIEKCDFQVEQEISSITPRADVLEIRYRVHEGRFQYRRWNLTKGRWEDADWIGY